MWGATDWKGDYLSLLNCAFGLSSFQKNYERRWCLFCGNLLVDLKKQIIFFIIDFFSKLCTGLENEAKIDRYRTQKVNAFSLRPFTEVHFSLETSFSRTPIVWKLAISALLRMRTNYTRGDRWLWNEPLKGARKSTWLRSRFFLIMRINCFRNTCRWGSHRTPVRWTYSRSGWS